jgi:hypothetical protein
MEFFFQNISIHHVGQYMKSHLLPLLLINTIACDRATMHGEGSGSIQDNLSEIFGSCKENEIGFLARKFNIQLAFENCGSNEFSHFSWSPAGDIVYFQLLKRMYLLHPETTKTEALSFYNPTDDVLWLSPSELVFANKRVGSEDEILDPPVEEYPLQMVFYNREGFQNTTPLQFSTVQDIQVFRSYTPEKTIVGENGQKQPFIHESFLPKKEHMTSHKDDTVVFLGKKEEQDIAQIYSMKTDEKLPKSAFSFVDSNVDVHQFSYCPLTGILGIVTRSKKELKEGEPEPKFDKPENYNYKLTLYNAQGTVLLTRPDIRRVNIHPDGRYMIMETDAEPIPSVAPAKLIYVSEEERQRDVARMKKEAEKLPTFMDKEIIPPEIQVLDFHKQEIWRILAYYGEHVQWYTARDYHISFILRGIDKRTLNSNIGLTNLTLDLFQIDRGNKPSYMELVEKVNLKN